MMTKIGPYGNGRLRIEKRKGSGKRRAYNHAILVETK